jgi:hypothetical protein
MSEVMTKFGPAAEGTPRGPLGTRRSWGWLLLTAAGQVSDISRSFLVSASAGDVLKLQFRASSASALLNGASTVGPAVTMTIVRIQ